MGGKDFFCFIEYQIKKRSYENKEFCAWIDKNDYPYSIRCQLLNDFHACAPNSSLVVRLINSVDLINIISFDHASKIINILGYLCAYLSTEELERELNTEVSNDILSIVKAIATTPHPAVVSKILFSGTCLSQLQKIKSKQSSISKRFQEEISLHSLERDLRVLFSQLQNTMKQKTEEDDEQQPNSIDKRLQDDVKFQPLEIDLTIVQEFVRLVSARLVIEIAKELEFDIGSADLSKNIHIIVVLDQFLFFMSDFISLNSFLINKFLANREIIWSDKNELLEMLCCNSSLINKFLDNIKQIWSNKDELLKILCKIISTLDPLGVVEELCSMHDLFLKCIVDDVGKIKTCYEVWLDQLCKKTLGHKDLLPILDDSSFVQKTKRRQMLDEKELTVARDHEGFLFNRLVLLYKKYLMIDKKHMLDPLTLVKIKELHALTSDFCPHRTVREVLDSVFIRPMTIKQLPRQIVLVNEEEQCVPANMFIGVDPICIVISSKDMSSFCYELCCTSDNLKICCVQIGSKKDIIKLSLYYKSRAGNGDIVMNKRELYTVQITCDQIETVKSRETIKQLIPFFQEERAKLVSFGSEQKQVQFIFPNNKQLIELYGFALPANAKQDVNVLSNLIIKIVKDMPTTDLTIDVSSHEQEKEALTGLQGCNSDYLYDKFINLQKTFLNLKKEQLMNKFEALIAGIKPNIGESGNLNKLLSVSTSDMQCLRDLYEIIEEDFDKHVMTDDSSYVWSDVYQYFSSSENKADDIKIITASPSIVYLLTVILKNIDVFDLCTLCSTDPIKSYRVSQSLRLQQFIRNYFQRNKGAVDGFLTAEENELVNSIFGSKKWLRIEDIEVIVRRMLYSTDTVVKLRTILKGANMMSIENIMALILPEEMKPIPATLSIRHINAGEHNDDSALGRISLESTTSLDGSPPKPCFLLGPSSSFLPSSSVGPASSSISCVPFDGVPRSYTSDKLVSSKLGLLSGFGANSCMSTRLPTVPSTLKGKVACCSSSSREVTSMMPLIKHDRP